MHVCSLCFDVWLTLFGMILYPIVVWCTVHVFVHSNPHVLDLGYTYSPVIFRSHVNATISCAYKIGCMCFFPPSCIKVSSGNLERSYRRAPKGAKEAAENSSGAGICHLCLGGRDFAWENLFLGFGSSFFSCSNVYMYHRCTIYIYVIDLI